MANWWGIEKPVSRGGESEHVTKCPKCSENTFEHGKCKSCGYETEK